MRIKFIVLPEAEFGIEYKKAFAPVDVPTDADKERMREAVFTTQQLIVDALKANWKEPDDYEVGWDFNYCYHVCGGIYSDRIVGMAYLRAIIAALAAAPTPKRWTYHTACETDAYDGEFFIRDGSVYLRSDSPRQLRRQFGCDG